MFEIAASKENQDNMLFDLSIIGKKSFKKNQPIISAEEYIDCENVESNVLMKLFYLKTIIAR